MNENDPTESNETQDSTVSSSALQESFLRSIRIESTRTSINEMSETFFGDETVTTGVDQNNQNENDGTDATIHNESTGINVIDNQSNNEKSHDNENDDEQTRKNQIEANLREVLLRGETIVFDGDLEYISIPNQELQAIHCKPEYRTKANDQLCGNNPFKENVRFHHMFHSFYRIFLRIFHKN